MNFLHGPVYTPEGFREAVLSIDDGGRLVDVAWDETRAPEGALRGVILPRFVNAHTHVGDRFIRGHVPAQIGLAELVAPPNGLKHRMLRQARPEEIREGMRQALTEMLRTGTRAFLDFREGGLPGLMDLQAAALEVPGIEALAYARPSTQSYHAPEVQGLLAQGATGLGLSGIGDVTEAVAESLAAHAKQEGRRFALHASEGRREDIQRVLALEPDFIVHMVRATREDLQAVRAADVPIVLCPRSNARFGPLPDVAAMLEERVSLALGTDNLMLHEADMLQEMRFLHRAGRNVPMEAILQMATYGGLALLEGGAPEEWPVRGTAADLVVLREQAPGAGPHAAVFGPAPQVLLVLAEGRPVGP
ncbi:MAG TPA: amidohydrolase family protein [Candidatus Thermoplasmatota archaeon]|nr:amidohydrolase family protein [Candidatus Thermoplasmatota archaeon]